jgi:hypothetical protein
MTTSLNQLEYKLNFGNDEQKIAALKEMRSIISNGEPSIFFDLAKSHIGSKNNDIRWQSLIVIGEYIPYGRRNDEIRRLILEFCRIDEDMQDALATVLLEHLLQHDFNRSLTWIKEQLKQGTKYFQELVERCWQFGQLDTNWHELQQVLQTMNVKWDKTEKDDITD